MHCELVPLQKLPSLSPLSPPMQMEARYTCPTPSPPPPAPCTPATEALPPAQESEPDAQSRSFQPMRPLNSEGQRATRLNTPLSSSPKAAKCCAPGRDRDLLIRDPKGEGTVRWLWVTISHEQNHMIITRVPPSLICSLVTVCLLVIYLAFYPGKVLTAYLGGPALDRSLPTHY